MSAEAPNITGHPADGTFVRNTLAQFSVTVDDPPSDDGTLTYEWHISKAYTDPVYNFNSTQNANTIKSAPGAEIIPDSNSSTLETLAPNADNPYPCYYYYWVTITNSKDLDGEEGTDGLGETTVIDSQLAQMRVVMPVIPPGITQQPAVKSTYSRNAEARFYVGASPMGSGATLSYEWHISAAYTGSQNLNDPTVVANIKAAGSPLVGGADVLTVTTPAVNATRYYYYWATVTNCIDRTEDGDTNDPGERASLDSNLAEAKIVNRTLNDHLINGDFSQILTPSGAPFQWWSNVFWLQQPQGLVPGWETTHWPASTWAYQGKEYEIQD
jgi:hypothetical protein